MECYPQKPFAPTRKKNLQQRCEIRVVTSVQSHICGHFFLNFILILLTSMTDLQPWAMYYKCCTDACCHFIKTKAENINNHLISDLISCFQFHCSNWIMPLAYLDPCFACSNHNSPDFQAIQFTTFILELRL